MTMTLIKAATNTDGEGVAVLSRYSKMLFPRAFRSHSVPFLADLAGLASRACIVGEKPKDCYEGIELQRRDEQAACRRCGASRSLSGR